MGRTRALLTSRDWPDALVIGRPYRRGPECSGVNGPCKPPSKQRYWRTVSLCEWSVCSRRDCTARGCPRLSGAFASRALSVVRPPAHRAERESGRQRPSRQTEVRFLDPSGIVDFVAGALERALGAPPNAPASGRPDSFAGSDVKLPFNLGMSGRDTAATRYTREPYRPSLPAHPDDDAGLVVRGLKLPR